MGEIKYNGRTYSGLIQANGCFIDTENVITSGSYSSALSYTATEDCYIRVAIAESASSSSKAYIDGNQIFGTWNGTNGIYTESPIFPLKKGQTLTVEASNSASSAYTVYGIQQGSNITFLSEYASACYDTNEREVGCWVDGKPIYQKTIVLNSSVINDEVHTDVTSLNIDRCVGIFGVYSRKVSGGYDFTYAFNTYESNAYCSWARYYDSQKEITHKIYLGSGESTDYQAITIRYTKTTDVAGSGQWTPMAQPTHHYSTSEQVIGTWIDGKPLYERVFTGLSIALNGNDWVYFNDPTDIENVIDFKAFADNSGRLLNCAITEYQRSNTNGIMFSGITGFNRTVNVIVARFTKTTD